MVSEYGFLKRDMVNLRAENVRVSAEKNALEDELRSLELIQNDVVVDLEDHIRLNGLVIDDGWRIYVNQGNTGLIFKDIINNGAYLFPSISRNKDIETVS